MGDYSVGPWGLRIWGLGENRALIAQRLQYPLIREYTLNHIREPTILSGIFLNYGVLESLGGFRVQGLGIVGSSGQRES